MSTASKWVLCAALAVVMADSASAQSLRTVPAKAEWSMSVLCQLVWICRSEDPQPDTDGVIHGF